MLMITIDDGDENGNDSKDDHGEDSDDDYDGGN